MSPTIAQAAYIAAKLGEALAILVAAWLLTTLLRHLLRRLCTRYELAPAFAIGVRRVLSTVIYISALLLFLNRMGISGSVVWTTLTGFVAVGAVAFFAAWSVLSNIFCALLILTTRPFRLYDYIEVLEGGDKPGLRGRVVDINFIFTTLQESHANGDDTVLQVPNSQFFQRSTRRWRQEPEWSRIAHAKAAEGADWRDAAAR
ncbi:MULTISPECIES: mechanosensitive ion channel domain-containing protein [Lysobacter]|jgi:small-conductance mechanosensitive channel|uniref:Small-conductance mechanosensitive channel n=1 Tax=Lysobacter gummosus TaxID=262324 RepID=A0ABY3XFF3_9GAMM|nr:MULTISPECIES: mechanosensitive ion channel domain-containing protein [Lysobacter]ALN89759.1 mechanosensitive ion channel family protein [Lysobacter gummosus]UJB18349.1 mechanosensitive ion channel family protein [Lysobacter capsici]UJQ27927.1 mechanosensitive ion channel family protein [Lysobacter gummosus]UNP30369.1 mechanosensitive ion channel family protein [Lysobacter gummosus]